MDVGAEQRYQSLKRRLDALHYTYPLAVESAPLVEKMLCDLEKSMERTSQLRQTIETQTLELAKSHQQNQPLKKENTRLIKENNALHLELIAAREASDENENKWRAALRKLEGEREDLKFLVGQKDHSIANWEAENAKMKSTIERLLSRAVFTGQDAALDKFKETRKQMLDMRSPLPPANNISYGVSRDGDAAQGTSNLLAELKEAHEAIEVNRKDFESLKRTRAQLEEKLKVSQKQVDAREKEIARLSGLLEGGGRDYDKLAAAYVNENNNAAFEQLSRQIDFLNTENDRLERELRESRQDGAGLKRLRAESEIHAKRWQEAEARNEKLKEELQKMDAWAKDLEQKHQEQQRTTENSKRETREVSSPLEAVVSSAEREVGQLKQENQVLRAELNRCTNVLNAYQSDKNAVTDMLQRLESERQSLDQMLQKEMLNRTDVETELASAKTAVEKANSALKLVQAEHTAISEELATKIASIRGLEDENDRLRREFGLIQAEVRRTSEVEEMCDRIRSELDASLIEQRRLQVAVASLTSDKQELLKRVVEKEDDISHLQQEKQRMVSNIQQISSSTLDVNSALQDCEAKILLLTGRVSTLENERRDLLEREEAALRQVEQMKTIFEGLDNTREVLIAEVSGLHQQMENELNERNKLNSSVTQLRAAVEDRESQLNNLRNMLTIIDQERDLLQTALDEKTEQLAALRNKSTAQETQFVEVQTLLESAHKRVDTQTQQLADREKEIRILRIQCENLNGQYNQLREEQAMQSREISTLTEDLSNMTRENQYVNQELVNIIAERDQIKNDLHDALAKQRYAQQIMNAREREQEEVMRSYRAVCEENERLQRLHVELQRERHESISQIQNMDQNLRAYHMQLNKLQEENQQYVVDLQTSQRQIDSLGKQYATLAASVRRD